MMQPLISIITPTYNHERFIAQCIESVINQEYTNWEQIIIDDGSSDKTWEIIYQYARNDERIRPYQRHHLGATRLAELYNDALDKTIGQWVAILEGDDYWLPNKLTCQAPELTLDTIICYSKYYDEVNGCLSTGPTPPFKGRVSLQEFTKSLLLHRSYMIAVTQIINKNALTQKGGFHQDISPAAVDMATLLELVNLSGEVVYIDQELGVWRHHPGQSTNLRAVELAICNRQMVIKYFDQLPQTKKEALGLHRNELLSIRKRQIADAYFGVLRFKLKTRDKINIHQAILGTWKYGGLKRKIQALYAVFAYRTDSDLEWILKYF